MSAKIPARLCLLALLLLVISGCAVAVVDLSYTPKASSKSPLTTLAPMSVAIRIVGGDWDHVGDRKNGFGLKIAPVKSNQKVSVIFHDAMKNEFENNGNKVVETEDAPADAVIDVNIERYWSDCIIHFFDVEMVGTINANITVLDPDNDPTTPIVSKPLTATFRESRQIVFSSAYERVLNGALFEFMRSFSRDPEIIKALRLAKQNGKAG